MSLGASRAAVVLASHGASAPVECPRKAGLGLCGIRDQGSDMALSAVAPMIGTRHG